MTFREMIDTEWAQYERAPMRELRNVLVALSLHSWNNTLQEQARLVAVQDIVSGRLARRMKERVA
jgi:hypothetical protein